MASKENIGPPFTRPLRRRQDSPDHFGDGPSACRGGGWPTSRCSRPTDRSSSSVLGLLYRPGRRPGRPHHACTCPCREPHRDSHFETALLGWTLWLRAPTVSFTKRAFFASLANSGGAAAWISGARTPRRSAVESTRTRLHDTCATGSCPLHWSTPTGTGCRGARPMFGGSRRRSPSEHSQRFSH